jgi:hypothetical protein
MAYQAAVGTKGNPRRLTLKNCADSIAFLPDVVITFIALRRGKKTNGDARLTSNQCSGVYRRSDKPAASFQVSYALPQYCGM